MQCSFWGCVLDSGGSRSAIRRTDTGMGRSVWDGRVLIREMHREYFDGGSIVRLGENSLSQNLRGTLVIHQKLWKFLIGVNSRFFNVFKIIFFFILFLTAIGEFQGMESKKICPQGH